MSSRFRARANLSTRLLIYYALAYLVLIGLMALIVDRSVRSALLSEVDDNLVTSAKLATESLPEDERAYEEWASAMFQASGYRTTLIDLDGVVLADSHSDPAVMENHAGRPEVQTAFAGMVGRSSRVSESTGFDQRYVALPPQAGLVVRTSVPTRIIEDELGTVRVYVFATAGLLGLAGIGVVAWLARRLADPITELTGQARAIADGDTEVVPRRSRVWELDELGTALSNMADKVGERLSDAERTTATLEVVLGALSQGTILFDHDDRVVYANAPARSMLEAVPDHLSGMAPLQLQEVVREARETHEPGTRVFDHGSPTRRMRGVATPFAGEGRILLLVEDITERDRTDAIRRDFVANASHELKTPVSTIIASSEALRMALERGDDSAFSFAARIEGSARQLDRLVGDLLDLSRLERDRPELAPVRVDHLVRDQVHRIRDEAEGKGISVDLVTRPVTAMVSQHDIAIATRNLLDNAIRYTPEGGSVAVAVAREEGQAVISVTDTGEGIPTRDTERVFERFYRMDSARSRVTGGTGLGLSIVKHVAESHGGSVSVDSELGAGSTFTIRLPADRQGEALEDN